MGNCISWDRRKSIWALRILSEVFLCTGIVACVAAFTIEVINNYKLINDYGAYPLIVTKKIKKKS